MAHRRSGGSTYAGTDDTLFMWPWVFLGLVRAARVLADREFHAMRQAPSSPVPALAGGGGNGRPPGLGRPDGPGPAIGTLPR